MKSKRHWRVRRVWVIDTRGEKHKGTLWWEYESTALIRVDGGVGLQVLPKAAEGTFWGFAKESDNGSRH